MKTTMMKAMLGAAVMTATTACYIGRANFEGENMHLYTPWHTTQISESASEGMVAE